MRFPVVMICDRDRQLVDRVRRAIPDSPWVLRHDLDIQACRALPLAGLPRVLILRPGLEIARVLEMLEWLQGRGAATRTILFLDSPDAEVETLAWNLGASLVLLPEQVKAHARAHHGIGGVRELDDAR